MKTDDYFQEMRRISELVQPELERSIKDIESGIRRDPSSEIGLKLVRERLKKPKLRDILTYVSYMAVNPNNDPQQISKACASMELLNCSTYAFNWILDQKQQVESNEDINNLIVFGNLLRERSQELLSEYGRLDLVKGIGEISRDIYEAQHLDSFILTYENIHNLVPLEKFEKFYNERVEKITGSFYGLCSFVGASIGEDKKRNDKSKEILRRFGIMLGTAGQIMNDLGDFVLVTEDKVSVEKSYKDQFSDIRQARLTLPAMYTILYGNDEEKNAVLSLMGSTNLYFSKMAQCQDAIISSGAKDYVLNKTKRYRRQIKELLHKLPPSYWRDILSMSTMHIYTNKYTHGMVKNV